MAPDELAGQGFGGELAHVWGFPAWITEFNNGYDEREQFGFKRP